MRSWLSLGLVYYFDAKGLRFSHGACHEHESAQQLSEISAGGWRMKIALEKQLHFCGALVLQGEGHQKNGLHCRAVLGFSKQRYKWQRSQAPTRPSSSSRRKTCLTSSSRLLGSALTHARQLGISGSYHLGSFHLVSYYIIIEKKNSVF